MLDGFKEQTRKICEGPYDNDIPINMRLLYLTRPKVEKFAKEMETKIPCEQIHILSDHWP